MSTTTVRVIFEKLLSTVQAHEAELGKLDAVAGDGDHGIGMVRGLKAACRSLSEIDGEGASGGEGGTGGGKGDGEAIAHAGAAFSDAAGGSSGALFGIFIITVGNKLAGDADARAVHDAMRLGFERMQKLGKSEPGQKTLLDTLDPFLAALAQAADRPLTEAWREALPAAKAGMESTKEMRAAKGRAAKLGDRSRGHADPGAVSMLYMLEAVGEVLGR